MEIYHKKKTKQWENLIGTLSIILKILRESILSRQEAVVELKECDFKHQLQEFLNFLPNL